MCQIVVMSRKKKLTADKARFAIASVIDGKLTADELGRLMDKIEKEDGASAVIKAYVQLMDYVVPKLSRIEHAGHDGGELSVGHILKQVSAQGSGNDLPVIEAETQDDSQIQSLPSYKPAEPLNISVTDHKQD